MQALGDDITVPDALSDKRRLSEAIKQRALVEGFQKVGIAKAEPLKSEGKFLNEWLERGYHATMQWMLRDPSKRANPLEILPDAKSIVVVAQNYYTPHKHLDSSITGKVSRYAWGDDYHDVVGKRLHSLLSWIEQVRPGTRGKVCVDIQPVMDKAWAVRAGLGWLGKHTNVITPELGSWIFIGELLLDIELEFEVDQIEDHCGTCTLCIDACPTDAIVEPYVLDSGRCISYGTIELRSESFPDEIEKGLSGWLYGCDICQDVCPWNRFEQTTDDDRFQPREGNVNANLEAILTLDAEQYSTRYRGSAIKRAKLAGLQRNAKSLLGRAIDYQDQKNDP